MRLRRDFVGFFAWGVGSGLLACVGVAVISVGMIVGDFTSGPFELGVVAAFAFWAVAWLSGAVCLEDGELRAGSRFRPQAIDRAEVKEARRGEVAWGRAASVKGIEVACRSDRVVGLRLSAHLGEDQIDEWISKIDEWASAT